MASSQRWFANASNFEVNNSQFTNIANTNNVTINNNDPVSTTLWSHVAAGAIFNSAARYAAGKCHPGTRRKIIDQIVDWINDPDPTRSVLWIYGPAGAGKSAIAQTICELVKESHPDNDGGSFFFTSGHPDCGNAVKLFTTLSYQLAIQFPAIRAEINNVLSRDPSLPTKSMEIQLLSLIIQPLLRCRKSLSHTPILIIDGLDECANEKGTTQGDIVALISKSIVEHNIPLRFMILSRPEYWIRDAFETAPLPNITLSLSLRDDVDTDKDIKAYLTEEFERIRVENTRFMSSVVPPWPPARTINHLVYEASGQFIYAATILKFVGNISKFSNPQRQLEIIMSPGPQRALAFSELDRLYATILSAYPQWATMKRVLAALLLNANPTIINVFLGVDSDELALVLDALSSLITTKNLGQLSEDQILFKSICGSLQEPNDTISFCHRSFSEFLEDESRSGAFHIDLDSDAVPMEIVCGYFEMVHWNLEQNYETEPHIFSNIELATYFNTMPRATGRSISYCSAEMLTLILTDMTAKLDIFDPGKLTHMHSVFYFINSMDIFRNPVLFMIRHYKLDGQDVNKENPALFELQSVWEGLSNAISLACRSALFALGSCTDFRVTPTLVYATEYWFPGTKFPLDEFSAFASVTDAIPSLKRHHYIFLYRRIDDWPDILDQPTNFSQFLDNTNPHWRNRGIWRDLRTAFTYMVLQSILEYPKNDFEEILNDDPGYTVVTGFFDSRSISDISDKDYFENTYNLAMLAVVTEIETWVSTIGQLGSRDPLPQHFLVLMLTWFNRQLANSQTVALLQNYDPTLQQKMTTVMKYIFEHGFLQAFTKAHCTSNYLHAFEGDWIISDDYPESTVVTVWPLRESAYKKNTFFVRWNLPSNDWQTFHDEVFGNVEQNTNPIIHPSEWHPHLVTRLLIILVHFLDEEIHPKFRWAQHKYKKSLSYITQCIAYALPTPENLDALRLIVYLYPQVTPAWDPPEGLWPSLARLIQKYDSSILSSEEKQLFLLWFNSEEHADIKTYMGYDSTASPSALEGSGETESTDPDSESEGGIDSL